MGALRVCVWDGLGVIRLRSWPVRHRSGFGMGSVGVVQVRDGLSGRRSGSDGLGVVGVRDRLGGCRSGSDGLGVVRVRDELGVVCVCARSGVLGVEPSLLGSVSTREGGVWAVSVPHWAQWVGGTHWLDGAHAGLGFHGFSSSVRVRVCVCCPLMWPKEMRWVEPGLGRG